MANIAKIIAKSSQKTGRAKGKGYKNGEYCEDYSQIQPEDREGHESAKGKGYK